MTDAQQDREHVTLVGGPMDGYRVPVTGWTAEQRATGVAHINTNPGADEEVPARVLYGPPEDHPDPGTATQWVFEGYFG